MKKLFVIFILLTSFLLAEDNPVDIIKADINGENELKVNAVGIKFGYGIAFNMLISNRYQVDFGAGYPAFDNFDLAADYLIREDWLFVGAGLKVKIRDDFDMGLRANVGASLFYEDIEFYAELRPVLYLREGINIEGGLGFRFYLPD